MARDSALEKFKKGNFESRKGKGVVEYNPHEQEDHEEDYEDDDEEDEDDEEEEDQDVILTPGASVIGVIIALLVMLVMISVVSVVIENVVSIAGLSEGPFGALSNLLIPLIIIVGFMAIVSSAVTRMR